MAYFNIGAEIDTSDLAVVLTDELTNNELLSFVLELDEFVYDSDWTKRLIAELEKAMEDEEG
jgi:hypothetical protein